jgi:hypothetical protein
MITVIEPSEVTRMALLERLRQWIGGRRRARTPEEKAAFEERRRRYWSGRSSVQFMIPRDESDKPSRPSEPGGGMW